ncbi:MAG TPA: redoxin domain-containing protein [Phycisphaerales bacterium]|nr:redoxin domain-containing protein [Phycisphaerales bacterium]HRQ74476.1 redoxin domain-containing protein [Phycisphaerales bacterium]
MQRLLLASTVAAALFAAPALALAQQDEQKTLTIGDKAPTLDVAHWLKGEEVTEFEEGKVYVVEFWATWCGPCLMGMPHLSEMQEKFADYGVTILGISDEKLQTVVNFLLKKDNEGTQWNEKTRYTLATDPDRSVFNDYMLAAGQRGIPTAFIVGKDGHIEWIGHPMVMDEPLRAIVDGEWNRAEFKTKFSEQQKADLKTAAAQRRLMAAQREKDWPTFLAVIDEMIEENPMQPGLKVHRFVIMLTEMDQPAEAYAYGATVVEEGWDNPWMLNHIAWMVVDDGRVKQRDLDFAMKAAKRASSLTDDENAAILDTLARVYFEKGDIENAIKWQRKAVEHADGDMAAELRDNLTRYEAAKKK